MLRSKSLAPRSVLVLVESITGGSLSSAPEGSGFHVAPRAVSHDDKEGSHDGRSWIRGRELEGTHPAERPGGAAERRRPRAPDARGVDGGGRARPRGVLGPADAGPAG